MVSFLNESMTQQRLIERLTVTPAQSFIAVLALHSDIIRRNRKFAHEQCG